MRVTLPSRRDALFIGLWVLLGVGLWFGETSHTRAQHTPDMPEPERPCAGGWRVDLELRGTTGSGRLNNFGGKMPSDREDLHMVRVSGCILPGPPTGTLR